MRSFETHHSLQDTDSGVNVTGALPSQEKGETVNKWKMSKQAATSGKVLHNNDLCTQTLPQGEEKEKKVTYHFLRRWSFTQAPFGEIGLHVGN